jgi:hypothetical protein
MEEDPDMTTTAIQAPPTRRTGSPLPALTGAGALAAFAGAVVVFNDLLAGSGTPEEAAAALDGAPVGLTAVLLATYALLAIAVMGMLAARLGRAGETASVRLLPLLGAGHVLLLTAAFAAPAAAVAVGTLVFDGGVTPGDAEVAMVLMNVAHPMAAWVGAGFLIAVAIASWMPSRVLAVVSAVFALGLLLPPVGWAVTYLMAFWFAGVGIWLWRRN